MKISKPIVILAFLLVICIMLGSEIFLKPDGFTVKYILRFFLTSLPAKGMWDITVKGFIEGMYLEESIISKRNPSFSRISDNLISDIPRNSGTFW